MKISKSMIEPEIPSEEKWVFGNITFIILYMCKLNMFQ